MSSIWFSVFLDLDKYITDFFIIFELIGFNHWNVNGKSSTHPGSDWGSGSPGESQSSAKFIRTQ